MKSRALFDDAIVIMHDDHGSRLAIENFRYIAPAELSHRDIVDIFSTLFAVKAPQVAPGYRRDQRSIQDLFGAMVLDLARPSPGADPVLLKRAPGPDEPFQSRAMVPFGAAAE